MNTKSSELMKIAIYGAGSCGKYVYDQICKYTQVICWIDNQKHNSLFGAPIYTEKEFVSEFKGNQLWVVIAIEDEETRQNICLSLINEGITEIYILDAHCFSAKLPLINKNGDFCSYVKRWDETKPVLSYLEFQVYDGCNLKCASCAHYSNVVENSPIPDFNEYSASMECLKKMFHKIKRIRLMGGEPLLNSRLSNYVERTRELFPYSDIRVVTNGLVLKRISSELVSQMKRNSILFEITYYPALDDVLSETIDFLNKNDLDYILSQRVDKFWIRTTNGNENPEKAFYGNACSKNCTFLRNNSLYVCPQIPLLYEQRDKFGFEIKEEEIVHSTFELSNDKNGWEAIKYLSSPKTLCRFCSREYQWKNWRGFEKDFDKGNYMVKEG